MSKLIYSMSTSADGFIEGPDGDFSWGEPGEELFRFHERYYDFPGLKLLLDRVGFRHILGFGCRAGEYSARAITLDDYEILVYAEKPAERS